MENEKGAYLFVCFQDTEEERDVEEMFYGVSTDGLNFRVLNKNKSVFKSTLGTKHLRDPFIIKGNDGYYYLTATDMDCRKGWTSQSTIVVYKSRDLINFDEGVLIDFKEFDGFEDCNRAWAPEIIWSENHINADGTKGAYMVYLSLQKESSAGEIDTVMYSTFATDLMNKDTYTTPKLLIIGADRGKYKYGGAIDGDIVHDTINNRYLMYFGGRRISQSISGSVDGPYEEIDGYVFDVDRIEGSNIYKLYDEDKWIIFADGRAFGTGFHFAQTTDFKAYKELEIGKDYSLDFTPRHSCVIQISIEEMNSLINEYGF